MSLVTLYNAYIGRVVAILAASIGLSVFLYGALLLGAVAHAAGRNSAEQELRRLSAETGSLEATYLAQSKSISLARAAELGFVAPRSVATVYADTNTLTLRQ